MFTQPTALHFEIPAWLVEYTRDAVPIESPADRMGFVIEASRLNIEHQTGGPFGAAIFESDTGKLVSLGVNLVTSQGSSILHAEMVAIALAQLKLGTYDLGRADLSAHTLESAHK